MARSRTRRAMLVLAGAMPLLACNAILGISDYENVECPGGGACYALPDDAGTVDAQAGDARSDALEPVDARGVDPVSWAQKPMPNYRLADAAAPDNPQVLTARPDGTVVDGVTGLTWSKVKSPGEKSWADATATCTGKWRLPTRIELITLLDLDPAGSGVVRADAVFELEARAYWTTSLERRIDPRSSRVVFPQPAGHWAVQFARENNPSPVFVLAETSRAGVICVAGT